MYRVDSLGLIFIDLYVPALTPRLNSTETTLQDSENMNLFAVCRICTRVIMVAHGFRHTDHEM
jgi:hypothetical protein